MMEIRREFRSFDGLWVEVKLDDEGVHLCRPQVAAYIRKLEAELQKRQAQSEAQSRAAVVRLLVHRQGRTQQEAERIVDTVKEGVELELETVKCWACDGTGYETTVACMGASLRECQTCYGSRTASRYALPK